MSNWNLKEANARFQQNKRLVVKLDDEDGPCLIYSLYPKEQKRLIDNHVLREYDETGKPHFTFNDLHGMAVKTFRWLEGWENFEGEISKDILKESCENFPTLAEAVSMGFFAAFQEKQSKILEDNEADEKN